LSSHALSTTTTTTDLLGERKTVEPE